MGLCAAGAQGAALLAAGFVFRDRVLRSSGLLLFLFCILKPFGYDLRQLDVPNRILSFVVPGVFLLAASWIYTRFREQIRRRTSEQARGEQEPLPLGLQRLPRYDHAIDFGVPIRFDQKRSPVTGQPELVRHGAAIFVD